MNKIKIVLMSMCLAVASVASAALLTTYVTTTGTAEIDQAVVFTTDDPTSHSYSYSGYAGSDTEENDEIENRSQQIAPIKFVTGYSPDGEGIDTSYWSTLELENKDAAWNIIADNTRATLTYELASDLFNYEFDATGLLASTKYSLIYYADKPDRFVDWGGNNPGALIVEFKTDANGDILATSGSKDLGMNLPHVNDANNDEYDYCVSDGYDLCHGAKIWLVPSSDYSEPELISWNPSSYLFETDMITYNDIDDDTSLKMFTGKLSFIIRNVFDIALSSGTYTITTQVNPVTIP